MIQKSSCKLSTKANRHFYDMAKIRVTIILLNINIFTIFETLFQKSHGNFTDNLPKEN